MTSLQLGIGVTLGTPGVTGTPATSGASTPSAPSTPVAVSVGTSIATWAIAPNETIYFNRLDRSTIGPTAWLAMIARYVFADGNAVLTAEPNIVVYTGNLTVGANLRRKSETYNSTYPGP